MEDPVHLGTTVIRRTMRKQQALAFIILAFEVEYLSIFYIS